MTYRLSLGKERYEFTDLKTLLAKATPARSGDELAGVAAASGRAGGGAMLLAEVPLRSFWRNR